MGNARQRSAGFESFQILDWFSLTSFDTMRMRTLVILAYLHLPSVCLKFLLCDKLYSGFTIPLYCIFSASVSAGSSLSFLLFLFLSQHPSSSAIILYSCCLLILPLHLFFFFYQPVLIFTACLSQFFNFTTSHFHSLCKSPLIHSQ